ncbi:MAG: hypothetical protein Kow00103_11360 [Candidatus Caldatribacteriota bacterium]
MQLQLIIAIVVAILAVVFALQNAIPITVSFIIWNFKSSLALVLLITLALGILMSLLVSIPSMIKRKRIISNQKKKIQELEKNLQEKMENRIEVKIKEEEPETPLE